MLSCLELYCCSPRPVNGFAPCGTGGTNDFMGFSKTGSFHKKSFVQFIYATNVCAGQKHYFSAEIQTAWQMPGMDSPWNEEVGESSAPVGANKIRFQTPSRIRVRR